MEMTIKIEAPELASAILALAEALKASPVAPAAPAAAPAAKKATAKKKEEPVKEEAAEDLDKPLMEEEPTPTPAPEPVQQVTLETVRAKLSSLSLASEDLQIKVNTLIKSFGVNKLSEIPPEKYHEVLEKAEGIAA
jgi:hypothetical protein